MVAGGVILCNRYLIEREVGAGGMGAVYAATDLRTGGIVAVKVLHPLYAHNPEYVSRLRREAQIAASIRTPRAVKVIDLDEHEGMPFLVMEYVEGESLDEILDRVGSLPLDEALGICIEINRALEGAHAVGVVHRDLKPQNVKMTGEGEVKVLDFGIARAENLPGITGTNMFTGTPEYCAPERLDGPGDIRSDIYSLGVMLYELLAGQRPFNAPTAFGVLRMHETAPVPPLPVEAPPEVQEILDRTLAKNPSDRYQTPGELMAALRATYERAASGDRPRRPVTPVLTPPTSPVRAGSVEPTVVAPGVRTVTRPPAPPVTTAPPTPRSAPDVRRLAMFGAPVLALALVGGVFALTRGKGGDETRAAATVTATRSATAAPPTATPAALLAPGQKVTLDLRQESPLPTVCLDAAGRPQVKSVIRFTGIERSAQDPKRVIVSYLRTVPVVDGVDCPLQYAPEANSNLVSLDATRQVDGQDRVYRVYPAGGTGVAIDKADVYGKEAPGSLSFDDVELGGADVSFVQRLADGRELHRVKLLSR